MRREDLELLCFQDHPENTTSTKTRKWLKAMLEAKYSIILTLETRPLAQLSDIIDDDDRTARELWDSIVKLCTISSEQEIINLEQQLKGISFEGGNNGD